jgi:uncharacterized protein
MNESTDRFAVPAELEPLVAAVVETARPLRIILFGSRARGMAGPDSDADLLIVQAEADAVHRSRWRELQRIRSVLRDIPLAKDLLLYRPQEFNYWRESLNHLVGRAVREGILLYERS